MKILFLVSFIFVSPIVLSQDCETSFTKMLTYEQAKKKVRELGVQSLKEYQAIDLKEKARLKLPVSLKYYYKKTGEWQSMDEFFGKTKLLNYKQAKNLIRELGVRSFKEYQAIDLKEKARLKLPVSLKYYYKKTGEWQGGKDFFGAQKIELLPYKQAKNLVWKLGVRSLKEYQDIGLKERQQLGLPGAPDIYYAKTGEWRGAYEFFGTQKIELLSYEQARDKVQELGIRNKSEYKSMDNEKRKSLGLPSNFREYYKKTGEWQGGKDFFGAHVFFSYKKRTPKIKNKEEPQIIEPKLSENPSIDYVKVRQIKKVLKNKKTLSYKKAKKKVQELGVQNLIEYQAIDPQQKKHLGLPDDPHIYYTKTREWEDVDKFFGTEILSYKKARKKVQELGVQNFAQYRAIDPRQKKRLRLPDDPYTYYAKTREWEGADDFFGYYIGDGL